MDNNAATTRLLHPLHMGPGPDSNEHTPFQGCALTSGDHQEAPGAFWTVQKPHMSCSHHKVVLTMTTMLVHPSCMHAVTMLPMCPNVVLYMHIKTTWLAYLKVTHTLYAHLMTVL